MRLELLAALITARANRKSTLFYWFVDQLVSYQEWSYQVQIVGCQQIGKRLIHTKAEQWRLCACLPNPADLPSRSISADELECWCGGMVQISSLRINQSGQWVLKSRFLMIQKQKRIWQEKVSKIYFWQVRLQMQLLQKVSRSTSSLSILYHKDSKCGKKRLWYGLTFSDFDQKITQSSRNNKESPQKNGRWLKNFYGVWCNATTSNKTLKD